MLVGYARVSTLDQNPSLQIDALREAGCEKIFVEKASGARQDRRSASGPTATQGYVQISSRW